MMPPDPQARKKAFKAALAFADVTLKDWAADHGVTPVHLHLVLRDERTSERLLTDIDAFIAQHTPRKVAATAA